MPIYKPNSVTVTRGSLSAKPLKVTVTSTAREMPHEPTDANPSHGSYMSREMWRDPDKRTRHDRHHEEGKGWRSRWHPKVLDYRTVDELGLTIEELDNERLPKTAVAKAYAEQLVDNMLIEGEELLIEEGKITLQPTTLQPDRTVYGEIKPVNKKRDTQFCFYKINVPDRDIPVGLKVTVVATQGDPDVYVCNRNTFPMQHPHEHTWKSQQAGDDTILIEPHDPSFFPGLFFISVFALNDSAYELTCTFEPQKVKIHRPIVSDGNGYQQSALGALNRGRRSPVQQGEEERGLSDIQKLERFDEGGDVLDTVVSFIAAQANVSADVIAARDRVPIEERVTLGKSEFNGMQSLLTQRLKHTLAAQDAARSNAYRFRAKAMQHLDLGAAGSWSPERALGLVNSESLKMKEAYDQNLAQHLDEISLRQEEARSAQERQMARQRLRTAFGAGQAGVRIMRAAKMAGAGKSGASPRAAQTGRRGSVRSSRESVRSTSSKESS